MCTHLIDGVGVWLLLLLLQVNGVLHVHLPDGPTAHYKITNLVLGKDIKVRPDLWDVQVTGGGGKCAPVLKDAGALHQQGGQYDLERLWTHLAK